MVVWESDSKHVQAWRLQPHLGLLVYSRSDRLVKFKQGS